MTIRKKKSNISFLLLLTIAAFFTLFTTACSDDPGSSNGDSGSSGSFSVEGELAGYDYGEQELYQAEDFVDLIEGTINKDGTFTVEFLGEEEVQEVLKPLTDDSEGFVSMYCRETVRENLDENHQFTGLNVFNFTYGEDTNVGGVGLSSEGLNRNIYPPSGDFKGDYQIRWMYSNQKATISVECDAPNSGTEQVELELSKGWNEVIFDLSENDNNKMYTGERPSEVNWVMET